jgi:hypothetical protein
MSRTTDFALSTRASRRSPIATTSAPEALTVLEGIADAYRVELVPLRDLDQAAGRHGAPLPEHVAPPAPETGRDQAHADGPPNRIVPARAPDATPERVRMPGPVGFDGRPLRMVWNGLLSRR